MKHAVKKSSLFILMIMLCLWFGPQTIFAADDTTTILVDVTYGQTDARSMLEIINNFRTGSDAWYWNSDNTTKTTCTSLSKLTYDYGLEKIAMQRAAEIALCWGHTRPNGLSSSTAGSSGYGSYIGENIAAGYRTAAEAFDGLAETAEPYSGQGHRRNMLSSNYTSIGIGHVYYGGYHYWVQEFSNVVKNTTAVVANDSKTTVSIDILNSNYTATPASEQGEYVLNLGESVAVPVGVQMNAEISKRWPVSSGIFIIPCTWTVTDSSIATISEGQMTGNKIGTTTIKTTVAGTEVSVPITVQCKTHTIVTIPAVEATCTEKGKTAGQKCSKCGNILKEQEEIAALGHAWDDGTVKKEATSTENGEMEYSCLRCGEKKTATIPVISVSEDDKNSQGNDSDKKPSQDNESGKTPFQGNTTDNSSDVPETGTTLKAKDGVKYQVTVSAGNVREVKYAKPAASNASNIVIPDRVTINGIAYNVTSVSDGAFDGNKKLTKVTIGKNVKKIGKSAFKNCKKLRQISIKSSHLTTIGNQAFKGVYKKAVFKVPSKKLAAYKKLLSKQVGYKKTMKIKK